MNGSRIRPLPLVALLVIAISVSLAACGGSHGRRSPAPRPHRAARPEETRCRDLATRASADRVARKLVDDVVAPEGQSERETIGIIGESLYATCKQPRLPGVVNVADYRPVKPVLAEIQRDFDEEEINGG